MTPPRVRIALSLPPEFVAILDRIAHSTGAGRATIIREWLLDSAPVFEQMAQAFELAAGLKPEQAFDVMAKVLHELHGDLGQAQVDLGKRRAPQIRRDT